MTGFADIIGHAGNLKVLRQAMSSGKVAHAYLFAGPAGVGKRTVAQAFAAALNCTTRGDDACGVCSSCHKLAGGNHPDIIQVEKSPDSRYYKIERIREVIKSAQHSPYESAYKVFLLDDAQEMTVEAANAMLKTLEEPGAGIVFLLISSVPHQLPRTVVSRCQMLRFGLLPDDAVRGWASANLQVDDGEADLIAGLADGSLGRAAELDLDFLRGPRRELFAGLATEHPDRTPTAIGAAETLLNLSPNLLDGIELLTGFVRDAVIWRLTGEVGRIRNRDALECVQRFAEQQTSASLTKKFHALVQARRLVERNVAKQVIATGLCLDLLTNGPTEFTDGRLPR